MSPNSIRLVLDGVRAVNVRCKLCDRKIRLFTFGYLYEADYQIASGSVFVDRGEICTTCAASKDQARVNYLYLLAEKFISEHIPKGA